MEELGNSTTMITVIALGMVSIAGSILSAFKTSSLAKSVVYKDACEKCEKSNDTQFEADHQAIQVLSATVLRIEEKLDRVLIRK